MFTARMLCELFVGVQTVTNVIGCSLLTLLICVFASVLGSVVDPEDEDGNMAEDDVAAAKSNHIKFGDCYINDSRTLSFAMTNHSKTDCIKFQWPEHPQLKYAPMVSVLASLASNASRCCSDIFSF